MGIDRIGIKLLIHSKQIGVDFDRVLTIGRQELFLKKKEFQKLVCKAEFPNRSVEDVFRHNKYSEPFLKLLGAKTVDSIDASDYEGSTLVHDLNLPIPDYLKSKYTLVIDGGSLEHVFNFPQAIKNCMNAVSEGGHFIGITPSNNFFGHGFYQFSPELFWRIFSKANGFEIIKMYFYVYRKHASIYEVMDPLAVKHRITMINSYPSYLFIIAKKLENVEIFSQFPQQSDYEFISWKEKIDKGILTKVNLFNSLMRMMPKTLQASVLMFYQFLQSLKIFNQTGISNNRYIRKVNLTITKKK